MAVELGIKARPSAKRSSGSDMMEWISGSLAGAMIWWTMRGSSARGTMRDSK